MLFCQGHALAHQGDTPAARAAAAAAIEAAADASEAASRRLSAELGAVNVNPIALDILERLATLARAAGSHKEAARLLRAADALRQRMGSARFTIYDAAHGASVATLRNALGEVDFLSAWAEGADLSTDEAIAYAQRSRGERKRPTNGWASLTPTEHDVVRLVTEGLANKDIATSLFVSPRTVQSHLTHVYAKLGLTSRVQLVQKQPATPDRHWGRRVRTSINHAHASLRCGDAPALTAM
jgi:DNA-binding CsgD family transcriptional regulator